MVRKEENEENQQSGVARGNNWVDFDLPDGSGLAAFVEAGQVRVVLHGTAKHRFPPQVILAWCRKVLEMLEEEAKG